MTVTNTLKHDIDQRHTLQQGNMPGALDMTRRLLYIRKWACNFRHNF